MKFSGAENRKRGPNDKKHYLRNVSVTCFQNVKRPYKTNRYSTFREFEKCIQTIWKQLQNEEIESKSAKRAPETLEIISYRRITSRVFAKQENLETNRKTTFWEVEERIRETISRHFCYFRHIWDGKFVVIVTESWSHWCTNMRNGTPVVRE